MDANAQPAGEGYVIGQLAGWQIKRVIRFIEENLTEPILLKDMSAVAQRSTAYFCRAFKRTFGRSPHAYLIDRRIRHAGDLMLGSDAPLSEIAQAAGFADQSHFCRHFRQVTGQTPAAWRRERMNDALDGQ
jgi:AraC-like DNA-binding protein